jgi:murein DD-endopeptidase MepM/ murein hydrolase activator NlpD
MEHVLRLFEARPHQLRKGAVILLLAFLVFTQAVPVQGQEGQPDDPVYVVKEGDSLWIIAVRFGISLLDLQAANEIEDPGSLASGDRLMIPGLEGVSGILDTIEVPYGETLSSLSRRYQIILEELARMNRLINPEAVFAGANLVLPADRLEVKPRPRGVIQPGQSLLEFTVRNKANPWSVVQDNGLQYSWNALPGEVLLLPGVGPDGPAALPEVIEGVQLRPFPLVQGKTVVLRITGRPGIEISGSLGSRELRFFSYEDGYVALQGIHAMAEPGLYPLTLKIASPSEETGEKIDFHFSQPVLVHSADYPFDPVLTVDPETVDPAVTEPEDALWASLGEAITPEKLWEGAFQSPVPLELKDCWTSLFGSRRSFNGSPYRYFHSGLDFCGTVGTELFAPALGEVLYTGLLRVRGNVVVIDHGWGVFTAYDHLSEILVQPGQRVQAGQVIGLGGETGRTTGPHLHWEVWVGGVQVDPVDWLGQVFP